MESMLFTEEFLEKFFEDNFIEDDELHSFIKGRYGTIEDSGEMFDDDRIEGELDREHLALTIKLKEFIA